jgi:hypothetical protein
MSEYAQGIVLYVATTMAVLSTGILFTLFIFLKKEYEGHE